MSARLHRLLSWLTYEMAPKSRAFGRDEQTASLTLYPTSKRGVLGTLKESPGAVGAAQGASQKERDSLGRYT